MVSNVLGDEVGKEVTVKFLKDNDEERTYTGLINSKVGLKNIAITKVLSIYLILSETLWGKWTVLIRLTPLMIGQKV